MSDVASELLIDTRANTIVDAAYESSPPWLVSTIVHLLTIIFLAVYSVGMPPEAGFELVLSPETIESPDLDLGEPAPVEITSDEMLASAAIDDQPLEVPSKDLMAMSLGDLFATEGDDASSGLLAGFGDELHGQLQKGYTSVFGLSGEGSRFVYVFDRSDSMNSVFRLYSEDALVRQVTPLQLAKDELLHSLKQLGNQHQFQIVFYNHEPRLFGDGYYGEHKLFPANPRNKKRASQYVEEIPGEGNTNHWAGLQAALPLRPDVMFLITDGEAKDDPPLSQVQSMIKFCRRKRIKVNVIHFSNTNRPYCTLIPLAEETGGQHLFIDLETFVRASK